MTNLKKPAGNIAYTRPPGAVGAETLELFLFLVVVGYFSVLKPVAKYMLNVTVNYPMQKLFLLLISGSLFLSCNEDNEIEYVDGKQRLSLNSQNINRTLVEIGLINHAADSVTQGEELILKITTSDKDYKIVNAMFDCPINDSSLVDTVTYKVDGCNKELLVKNDTILIAFKPNKVGRHQFSETVTGISKGKDNVLRYHTGTFNYTVVEKN